MSDAGGGWSWLWPRAVFIGIPLVGLFGPVILLFLLLWSTTSCTTQSKQQIHDVSGLDFEISETYCDTAVDEVAANVLVSATGEREKTPLLRFDPVWWAPPPDITVDAQRSTIVISLLSADGADVLSDHWRDMAIKYDVAGPDDPRFLDARRRAFPGAQ